MIFDELDTGFRWYDSLDKQNRFKEYCANLCDFALISLCDDLLPFQIRTDSFGQPTQWLLKYLDGEVLAPVITPSVEPCAVWTIQVLIGGTINIHDTTNSLVYGTVDYAVDVDSTMANLVASVNTNTPLGTMIGSDPFDNSAGFTASWDIPSQTLTVCAPVGSGTIYNGTSMFFEFFGGALALTPGQFIIISGGVNEIIVIAETDTVDISDCIGFLNQYTIDGHNYLQYTGGFLTACMPVQMACGKWYSEITDDTNTVYSEVFEVIAVQDIPFEQMKLPLFTAFRWYDSIDKQSRYKEYCANLCDFYLLTGNDSFLPFQIKAPDGTTGIQSWRLVSIDGTCEVFLDTALITITTTNDGDRITYNGNSMTNLVCGKFYSVIDDGVTIWYSELVEVVDLNIQTGGYLQTDDGIDILTDDGVNIMVD